jgi:hypothetical protein
VPSNEIVRLEGFPWIECVLADEFTIAKFPLFLSERNECKCGGFLLIFP